MNYKIINPSEDMYGNQKENIFLALNEEGRYLAHAYVYPFENEHVSYAFPKNIMVSIACKMDNVDARKVKENLLDSCIYRAKTVKKERWPREKVRVYTGMAADAADDLNFFLQKGFKDDDGAVVLERNVVHFQPRIDCTYKKVYTKQLENESDKEAFLRRYHQYFVQEMDIERLNSFIDKKGFALLQIFDDEKLLGEALVYEEDNVGKIEQFYIVPEARGGNTANILMEQTLWLFVKRDVEKVRLEVWERNKRALYFYSRFGFQLKNGRTEIYPGFEL